MNIRLLRGQVVVRENYAVHSQDYPHLVLPESRNGYDDRHAVARGRTWHIGEVIAMGAPALTKKGAEVPHGFAVGDTVIFHWEHNEEQFTRPWTDGKLACWMTQRCVDAVVET